MDFICFSTCCFFSLFIGFGLGPSGSSFDGFFLFFDLQLLLPFYCHGLRPSGSVFHGFFLFFDIHLLFPFYWLWIKAFGIFPWWIFSVFRLAASFSFLLPLVYGRWVQALMDILCFSTYTFFSHFIAFGLRPSASGFDGFSLFFDWQLLLPFYCVWFKAVGFRLWQIFFVFWLAASFPILLRLV